MLLALSISSCGKVVALRLVGANNPPTFSFSGHGEGFMFAMEGPFQDEATLHAGLVNRGMALWWVEPANPRFSPSRAPDITYGTVPPGMTWSIMSQDPGTGVVTYQVITTPPPPLIAGNLYAARATSGTSGFVVGSNRSAVVCFRALAGSVVELPCGTSP